MNFTLQYSRIISCLVIVTLLPQLSGCYATYGALKKVEPKEQISKFDSIFISQHKDISFNFVVQTNIPAISAGQARVKEPRIEEVWCAKLPLDKVIKNSKEVNQSIQWNSPESEAFYSTLNSISASDYTLIKSKCVSSTSDNIPIQEFGIGYIGEIISFWEKNAPVKFISPKLHMRQMDYGYMVLKTKEPIEKIEVTKMELPLSAEVYDKKNIVLLPGYIVFDIIMSPVYLLFIVFGKGYM
jgi:hypothetical protein